MTFSKINRPHRLTAAAVLVAVLAAVSATPVAGQTPLNLYGRGVAGLNGVVAAAKPEASQVGIEILTDADFPAWEAAGRLFDGTD
jgi:hypothetical protein